MDIKDRVWQNEATEKKSNVNWWNTSIKKSQLFTADVQQVQYLGEFKLWNFLSFSFNYA